MPRGLLGCAAVADIAMSKHAAAMLQSVSCCQPHQHSVLPGPCHQFSLAPSQPGMAGARGMSSGSQHMHSTLSTTLQEGNSRRKTESTDANAASSRSHAILEVTVCRSDRNHYQKQVWPCKLPSRWQQL